MCVLTEGVLGYMHVCGEGGGQGKLTQGFFWQGRGLAVVV